MPGFLAELNRRHVWRVATAYAVVAWLLVQIATQVFPFFEVPAWTVRLVVIALAFGFPLALLLAWIYELTPEGIRRTAAADAPDARPAHLGRRVGRHLDVIIISCLALAVLLLAWRVLVLQDVARRAPVATGSAAATRSTAAPEAGNPAAATPTAAAHSIAVLPFANDSGERDQQYFSDGLSEDLITMLSRVPSLKVICRESSFQFRNSSQGSKAVGEELGVAHLLEGSVRRAGGLVRVNVRLVRAADGRIIWSQRFDRSYRSLFALQDEITRIVATALDAQLLGKDASAQPGLRPASGNLAAYTAYMQGRFHFELGSERDQRKALERYAEAVRLDPGYARAWASMSLTMSGLANQSLAGEAARRMYAKAREAADTALRLEPDLSIAHRAQGYLLLSADLDWAGAEAAYRRALEEEPRDAASIFAVGDLSATLGRSREAVSRVREALALDPLHAVWKAWLAGYFNALGRTDEASVAIRQAIELRPQAAVQHAQAAMIEIVRGDAAAALAAAKQEPPGVWQDVALGLAAQISGDARAADAALQTLVTRWRDAAPYQIAQVHALRGEPDRVFEWLDHAWVSRDPAISFLLYDPFILRYRNDPRFVAYCRKMGLPASSDAVAMAAPVPATVSH